ncbi:MAG: hypothetical protein LBD75_04515 [Candidatus Peribacteria bacterium]|jgi:hypothetical protein|nr:hypothetical protein [Candidatus Peribacteria bacterium]
MQTGILSTNNIVRQTTDQAMTLNNTEANVPLFELGTWNNLQDPNAEFGDLREEQRDKTIVHQKKQIELNIEKNRTLNYLITSFELNTKSEYVQNQSP